jgi:hypothetical protein
MTWILIAVSGLVAWLSVSSFFLALCHAAGRAEGLAKVSGVSDLNVIDLRSVRGTRRPLPSDLRRGRATSYFSSRESRRSLSSRPPVWQAGQ